MSDKVLQTLLRLMMPKALPSGSPMSDISFFSSFFLGYCTDIWYSNSSYYLSCRLYRTNELDDDYHGYWRGDAEVHATQGVNSGRPAHSVRRWLSSY